MTDSCQDTETGLIKVSDEEKEMCQSTEPQCKKEGGLDWLIVIGCFLLTFIGEGQRLSTGIFFVDFKDTFQSSSSSTAWIQSLHQVAFLGSGPVLGALLKLLGPMYVITIGSILAATGLITSSLASNITTLYFTFGILNGAGLGIVSMSGMVLPSYYFTKRRALATTLAISGGGVGAFALAPLTTALIDFYGWRGASYILAGLALQACVVGFYTRVANSPCQIIRPVQAASPRDSQQPQNVTSADQSKGISTARAFAKKICHGFFSWSLLKNMRFTGLVLARAFAGTAVASSFVFIPDRAISYGLDKQQASLVISVAGVASLTIAIMLGVISDMKVMRERRAYVLTACYAVSGVITILSSSSSFIVQMIYAVTMGLALQGLALLPVAFADAVGITKLATAFGMSCVPALVISLIGPSAGGWIYDSTNDYSLVFDVYGAALCLAAVSVFIPNLIHDIMRTRRQAKHEQTTPTSTAI